MQDEQLAVLDAAASPQARRPWRRLTLIVLLAFAVRLAVLPFLYSEQLDPAKDHWKFGYETGRIARSLAEGKGFSSPLFADTGPTAWATPVYPAIVALVFKLFGVYSTASAFVLLSFNGLTSALTCIPIFLIALKTFGERTAWWAAGTWAIFPYGIYFPMERIWETWLATLLLAFLFLLTLQLAEGRSTRTWAGYGLLWGVAGLTSPTVLAVLPFLGVWAIFRLRRKGRPWLLPNAIAALAFLVVVAPWFVRNYEVFHRFIPFRDNMGLVLRLGTKGKTDYWGNYELGPWHNEAEWREFQQQGELRYMDHKREQALAAIASDPGWYAWTALRRAVFIWTGYWSLSRWYLRLEPLDPPNILFATAFAVLALLGLRRAFRRDRSTAWPYALVMLSFPVVYYFTSPEVYYRRPIDPMMLVLAAGALIGRKSAPGPETDERVTEAALAGAED